MDDKIYMNLDALVQQVKDQAMVQMAAAFVKDKAQKELITRILETFVSHGVDVLTAMNILGELLEVFKGPMEENK